MMELEERFWIKVDKNGPDGYHYLTGANLGPCWLWTKGKNRGYGRLKVDGVLRYAHCYAYELLVGPIPTGLRLDHLCRVRHCVRHTEPVTNQENARRGLTGRVNNANKSKTHCPHGHEYAGRDLGYNGGRRRCLACHRERELRRYRARKKEVCV